ncbi:MAG TPA: ethanolamine ammonia lyase-activating protein [Chloroflexota bacterium]|jgi:mannose-6-phosphate isomerase-like protein (cupin superfamily)|nr:ethanolamine ammonia lyase-activating protein [Chloroflexota bacterium]
MAIDWAKLDAVEPRNYYEEYLASENIPINRGFAVEDLRTTEVKPWARTGVNGAFIVLDGTGGTNDAQILEIPGGKSTTPMRHMYEEFVYVLDGSGATTVWYDENKKLSFEWGKASLFAIPLNAHYQFHNGSGSQPARMLSVTDRPIVMNLFHDNNFVFNCEHQFTDRFSGEEDYFSREGKLHQKRVLSTNFIADADGLQLHEWKERGAGGRNIMFELADSTMAAHISEFPVGTYKKAHRHGPGAHVIILNGVGFSLLWPEGDDENKRKVPWKTGSMVVPPDRWFHEHFNVGSEPARYLALRWGSARWKSGGVFSADAQLADVSVKKGGLQIEYEDEDPAILKMFEEDCAKNGAKSTMREFIAQHVAERRAGNL